LPPSARATCPQQRGLSDDRARARQRRHFQGARREDQQGRQRVRHGDFRDGKGDAARWWKALVFGDDAMAKVLRLGDGDPLAVAGEFDCQAYKTDAGEDRLSWSIMVDTVLSARAKPKQRAGREVAEASWAAP
jgi:hypothetical protein